MVQGSQFTTAHEQVLRDLVVDETSPGTILRDFEACLSYLDAQDLPLTGKHQLPLRVLPEINARLTHPIELGLKRPLQKSYPHVNGLYLLVRASGLTYVQQTSAKPLLMVDGTVLQTWQSLNPSERYCSLLEIWLLRGHQEIIGERQRGWFFIPETFRDWRDFCRIVPDAGMPVPGNDEAETWLRFFLGWHNLGLLELFGLMDVQRGPPQPGKGWCVDRLRRTPLGDALLALLYAEFFGDVHNVVELEAGRKVPVGVLQPLLQTYFPEWKNTLLVPEWGFREGTYIFVVSLGSMWRRIAIPGDQELDALASIILDALDFDHDHLYMFSYQNRYGREERVFHPFMDEGPWASEVLLGDLPLRIGQTMTYLYDFGDNWEFDVTLERVDAPDVSIKAPTILESHGAPPDQYGWWGDDDV